VRDLAGLLLCGCDLPVVVKSGKTTPTPTPTDDDHEIDWRDEDHALKSIGAC